MTEMTVDFGGAGPALRRVPDAGSIIGLCLGLGPLLGLLTIAAGAFVSNLGSGLHNALSATAIIATFGYKRLPLTVAALIGTAIGTACFAGFGVLNGPQRVDPNLALPFIAASLAASIGCAWVINRRIARLNAPLPA
jgi:hypothetical protein